MPAISVLLVSSSGGKVIVVLASTDSVIAEVVVSAKTSDVGEDEDPMVESSGSIDVLVKEADSVDSILDDFSELALTSAVEVSEIGSVVILELTDSPSVVVSTGISKEAVTPVAEVSSTDPVVIVELSGPPSILVSSSVSGKADTSMTEVSGTARVVTIELSEGDESTGSDETVAVVSGLVVASDDSTDSA
jgi:hypothetical protein